ncbi:glycosyltransferase family 2 protein [Hyunsoonleella aestuarii]|uniref:Glycosyltransferase n=1 Tax=Hyunsoonleella aestuarii TaxID=912802 RepID=A0ABP8EBK3_9FLAO|nr:glycosyltransferase family 2 protein [Hyunsoonleella aestuarii]
MPKPLVSILTPFKDTELFLEECLNSIINQTYTNWELLIVDDNSSDGSYNLVENFAKQDQRIKLLINNGKGIIDALRLAFKNSNGSLITRMDSDDIMHPKKLDVLVNNLSKYGKQHIAVGQVRYFSKAGIGDGYKSYETWLNKLTETGHNYSEVYKECVIPSPCWMIHREDLVASDAFNPNIYPEDYDLTFRFYKHKYKCIPCNKVIHFWRDYPTRSSRTDSNYAENHFINLKINNFIAIDYNENKTLVIWGAGKKGKITAKTLVEKNITFRWICDNPNKIGRDIYGVTLEPFSKLKTIKNAQSIITVANKKAQKSIINYMNILHLKPTVDYIFFC